MHRTFWFSISCMCLSSVHNTYVYKYHQFPLSSHRALQCAAYSLFISDVSRTFVRLKSYAEYLGTVYQPLTKAAQIWNNSISTCSKADNFCEMLNKLSVEIMSVRQTLFSPQHGTWVTLGRQQLLVISVTALTFAEKWIHGSAAANKPPQ